MKLKITTVALLLGMVFANHAQANVIFGNRCTTVPAPGPAPMVDLECQSVVIRVETDQSLVPPLVANPLPACPTCAFAEIIDIPGLDLMNVKAPIEFAVASRLTSDPNSPLFASDNQQIPNLVLTYVGNQTISGPVDVGLLELTVSDWPENIVALNYHARAFVNGQLVANTGSIAIEPAFPVPSLSPLAIALLGILMGLGGYRRLHA
ncbi:MAG: hypothetical protein V3T64_00395 [Myxococcota bacterium]